jgi:hypothetical protein
MLISQKTVFSLVMFLCVLAAFAPAAFSQESRAVVITVRDGDLDLPLEGARVVSWDGTETVCDAAGTARVSVPAGRSVVVLVSYPGYESARIAVRPGTAAYTASLRLGGVMEEKELVIAAQAPDSSATVSGRSVSIGGRELARHAETGVVEDVMRAVKLLPGVGYVGGYMAMPSVRGGEPSDVTAVFDGFYMERPYHWGGAFSIFDPKMVESAQLSHGVFTARYGHTISGLLDIHAKQPSPDTAGLDMAVSTSSTNLNLSFPLGDKGGVSAMGKVTYYDPFVEFAKLFFDEVKYVSTAPYIRSGALAASWNFSTDVSLSLNGFFGGDGTGIHYDKDNYAANFFYDNKIGFLTLGLVHNPAADMVLKYRLGAGLIQSDVDGDTARTYPGDPSRPEPSRRDWLISDRTTNLQGRFDLDKDVGGGFLAAAGLEGRYSRWDRSSSYHGNWWRSGVLRTSDQSFTLLNQGVSSALYSLLEYRPENRRFGVELGLRADHFFLIGEDFTLTGIPVVNPRLNVDFSVLEDTGPFERMSLTLGTGLFSSINSALQNIEGKNNIGQWTDTQNRSWTSVAGTKIDFSGGYSFTLEGYVKYVFSRAYTKNDARVEAAMLFNTGEKGYYFDGEAFIWGFDLMLQKFDARFWDGWISYSYINARYRDPQTEDRARNRGGWYYPDFHRFHTLNLIFNLKPARAVNLGTRFSIASGIPMLKTVAITGDPNIPGSPPPYKRIQDYDDNSRMGPVFPLDIKLSLFSFRENGKVKRELYLSFENLLSLVYTADGPKDFDSTTGEETPGFSVASYDLPIPLITFGIKWSY